MDADRRIETARARSSFASESRLVAKRDEPMLADNPECDFAPVDTKDRWDIKSEAIASAVSTRTRQLVESLLAKAARPGIGAMNAVKKGVAVVDEDGRLRCPPGTPNAMEFTDNLGTNCGIPGARVAASSIGTVAGVVGSEKLPRIGASEIAKNRSGEVAKRSARTLLAEGTRKFLSRKKGKGEDSSAWREAFSSLSSPGEGFSFDIVLGENATDGYAIARPGRGIAVMAEGLFDENGEPAEEGAVQLARMISANADEILTPASVEVDGKKVTAERVVLGGWHSDKAHNASGELVDMDGVVVTDGDKAADLNEARAAGLEVYGFVYFDVSDVFSEDIGDTGAHEIGKARNQQSVANLRLIGEGNFDGVNIDDINNGLTGAFIDTSGTGADLLPEDAFDRTVASAVRAFAKDGPLEKAIGSIGGMTMDMDNFTPEQVEQMLGYLRRAPGFEWIDPSDESHMAAAISQLADNLVFLMDQTTEDQRKTWSRWYDIAKSFNDRVAKETGVSERTMAAVIASLSPQKDWDQNTAMAEHLARLLSDEDIELSERVSELAHRYALAEWLRRQGTGRGSYGGRISGLEKKISESEAKIKAASGKDDRGSVRTVAGETAKIAKMRAEVDDITREMDADKEPVLGDFLGRNLMGMSDLNASAAIRAHSELEGGAYLGMPDSPPKTKKKGEEQASMSRLRPYTTVFGDGAPGDHTLVPKDGTVMATSFATYATAVKLFRSDGDPATIDRLLNGSKVRSFFTNILMPNDETNRDVTIDTHAVAAELLTPVSANHIITDLAFTHVDGLGTARAYPAMRAAMIAAAIRWQDKTGEKYLPRQIQSITWEKMRDLIPPSTKKFVVDRMAQLQSLANGPKADPRFIGAKKGEAVLRLVRAATIDLKQAAEARGKKVTREQLLLEVAQDLGLPVGVTKLPRASKAAAPEEV
jgi:hypothetical protein